MDHAAGFPHHDHEIELGWDQLVDALEALKGSRVAVRVVDAGNPERLVVVFRGHLGSARHDKSPTVFWPVDTAAEGELDDVEEPGIHLYPDGFGGAASRAGGTVVIVDQGPVLVNVRQLS